MYGCVPNNKENEKVNLWSNKESAKEWVSRDFGKLGEVPNSVIPVQQQGSQQLSNQQQRQDRDNNAKENNKDGNGMENDMQINQDFYSGSYDNGDRSVEESVGITVVMQGEQNVCLEIMEIPKPVQIDESFIVTKSSPNKVIHDIVSHSLGYIKCSNQTHMAKGVKEVDVEDDSKDHAPSEADLSPRLMKISKKG
ncbi:hypothetical protein FXO38_19726 [Capsicum annuum]|nr:hypothetical protein FXO38_19726 [Capsicum annuum]KAF3674739.1 hypothetical protein FXO37_06239 [Capsicum annuum]